MVASGYSSAIVFTPLTSTAHTISARVVGEFGLFQDVAQTVNVAPSSGLAEAGVNWSKLVFAAGENLTAVIVSKDSGNAAPSRITWVLYRNGSAVLASEGAAVNYAGSSAGLYRLKGTAYCHDGSRLDFDSTVIVGATACVRHALPVPVEAGTSVYLGAVFTQNITSAAGVATSLPYQTASATEDIFLLPGTTHWTFDLDPSTSAVDDEIVVRTRKGNWCLNGLGGGLTGEDVGYDYGYAPELVAAPADRRIQLTVDMFKVHGLEYNGVNCRVRIKCYRQLPTGVYRYERCTSSNFPGGTGRRARRWAAMFTRLTLETDAVSGLDRLGNGSTVVDYTTVNTTSVPLMTLSTGGAPNPVQGHTGLHYTDSNLYAYYEAHRQPDIAAYAVSGIELVRPCCLSLMMFRHSKPLLLNRVKRVAGTLAVYITDGVVNAGSVVNVKIYKSGGLMHSDYTVPIERTQYVNVDNVLMKVGEVAVDVWDFQFDTTGIVIDITVDESSAVTASIPAPVPTPVTSPDYIYSPIYAHTVSFDGACYTNPAHVPVFDDDAVLVTPIEGCQATVCGPSALYCYTAVSNGSDRVTIPQPFGFPAPYVARSSNPAYCYQYQSVQADVSGTNVSTALYNGSSVVELWGYTGTALCGSSYVYNDCQSRYAPCGAHLCSIIVVYPSVSSPHAQIEYGGNCYSYAGSTTSYGTRAVVSAVNVNPVPDCLDPSCSLFNASGSVVVYNDMQTHLEVPVRFDHITPRIGNYGVAPQVIDNWIGGLEAGSLSAVFHQDSDVLIYSSQGTGSMMFEFGLSGVRKHVVLNRSGVLTVFSPGIGGGRQTVNLLPGDKVYLRITDAYGRLPLQCRGLPVVVRWHPMLSLPRLYDTVVVAYTGSTTINALGFCAYTTQGAYTYYGTLPFNGSMTGPVNPDSLVTVTGADGQEYNIVSARAVGDTRHYSLGHLPWYAGQTLNGPFTFKFYAAREAFGAHGEMDVWFDTNGSFPGHLRAGAFDALELSGTYYRRDTSPADTERNAYSVVSQSVAAASRWPAVYVSSTGEIVSVGTVASSIVHNGNWYFSYYWPVVVPDPGLSYTIVQP